MRNVFVNVLFLVFFTLGVQAQSHDNHDHHGSTPDTNQTATHDESHHEEPGCGHIEHDAEFDPQATAFHHIADANVYSIGPWNIPLPCFLYAPEKGWSFFSSSKFGIGHHGTGHKAVNGYILDMGTVKHVPDPKFPKGEVEIGGIFHKEEMKNGKKAEATYVCYNNEVFKADYKSTADGGIFGGGITSFYDFSITKNVVSMFIVAILMGWMFFSIAKAYRLRDGQAPRGVQSFIEPIILFIQEEVAKPFLGNKWERYLPLLLSFFFFILGLNLFGQIPFLGGSNVTGNLAVTMVLALVAIITTYLSGNRHFWQHVFWMPGLPAWVTPIISFSEILGLVIKPLTLMLRLFANITAGHVVIMVFVGLIFVFGESGKNPLASWGTAVGSTILTMFMMSIELLVAFIQAFVFTILTASYLGAATEEPHHHH